MLTYGLSRQVESIANFAFNGRSRLKSLLGMFKGDIRIMIGPDNTIDTSRQGDEEARTGKFLDYAFDDFPDLDIAHLQKLLLNNRWLEGELQETIKAKVACYTCSMEGAGFPWASRRKGWYVIL